MARKTTKTSRPKAKRGRRTGPDCKMLRAPVTSIGEFFNTCSGLMKRTANSGSEDMPIWTGDSLHPLFATIRPVRDRPR